MFIWISCFDKDNDIDKYKYLGYGIEFGSRGGFLFPGGNFTKTVIVFGVDMSSSVRPNNKTKNIIILCEGITEGLDDIRLLQRTHIQ